MNSVECLRLKSNKSSKTKFQPSRIKEIFENDREAAALMWLLLWAAHRGEDVNLSLSRWIREQREERGLTQSQLGDMVFKSGDVIHLWESWAAAHERGREDCGTHRVVQFKVSDIVLVLRAFSKVEV
jgi:ribosome-binding protein aMBF1 (putative translation factor)